MLQLLIPDMLPKPCQRRYLLSIFISDKLEQPCRKTKDDARYWEVTTRRSHKGGAIDSSNRGKHDNSAGQHWVTDRPGYVINTTTSAGRDGNPGSNSKPQITLGERTSGAPGGIINQPGYFSLLISVLLTKLFALKMYDAS